VNECAFKITFLNLRASLNYYELLYVQYVYYYANEFFFFLLPLLRTSEGCEETESSLSRMDCDCASPIGKFVGEFATDSTVVGEVHCEGVEGGIEGVLVPISISEP
jgi:hypothetical protein